mgnify:CR=1 FL=1
MSNRTRLPLGDYYQLLLRHGLLADAAPLTADLTHPVSLVSCDSKLVIPNTLFVCKGVKFKEEYLRSAMEQGAFAYVSEREYPAVPLPCIRVTDIRKAMGLLADRAYGHPSGALRITGITGTKGKTTTSHFTQALINAVSGGKAALFSSVDNCLDGHTYVESDLTTPESMDAFRMMREAADNGMKYLVMEVSSQAYKVDRVYGLTFDVAAFLNISPDHISPIEHPTFEDYLYCKRQIIVNAKSLVLGADSLHADLLREDAEAAGIGVTTFALHDADNAGTSADVVAWPADPAHASFHIADGDQALGDYHLSIDGDFNYLNAAAAIAIAHAVGVSLDDADALHAIESVRIAGRMEQFRDPQSNTLAIVDYAHNYASVTALLDFVYERWGEENPRITLVTGSAGNKAYDRRKEIVEAAENRIANFIFTAEDTDTEPIIDICMEMQGYITNKDVVSTVISDRLTAITNAIYDARAHADRFNILLIIGKGNERWIKDHRKHVPFDGDDHVVERMFGL